jgi:phage terminase small subunit
LPDRRLALLKSDGRNRGYPRAVPAAPDNPNDLEPEAERLWDAVVPELERLRLLSRLDG